MTSQRMARLSAMLTASLIIALAAPAVAHAWVIAGGNAAIDQQTLVIAYGVRADTYVYPKEAQQDGDMVNSLYARQWNGDFVEAGWYWSPSASYPIWFTVVRKDDVTYPEETFLVSGNGSGKRFDLAVRRAPSAGGAKDTYQVFVDNSLRYTWYYTGTTSCLPSAAGERYKNADVLHASWIDSTVCSEPDVPDGTFQWITWPDAVRGTFVGSQWPPAAYPDSVYEFYTNKIHNSSHCVYIAKDEIPN